MARVEQLCQTLQERRRTGDVAQMVLALMEGHLTSSERHILEKAAQGSLESPGCWVGMHAMLKAIGGVEEIS